MRHILRMYHLYFSFYFIYLISIFYICYSILSKQEKQEKRNGEAIDIHLVIFIRILSIRNLHFKIRILHKIFSRRSIYTLDSNIGKHWYNTIPKQA